MNSMMRTCAAAVLLATAGCGAPGAPDASTGDVVSALAPQCATKSLQITDIHADFRDIWKGAETLDTGKQAEPNAIVSLDFNATVQPSLVVGSFAPLQTDGSCGSTIAAVLQSSVLPVDVWGNATVDSARDAQPALYSVLAQETITGVASAAGPLAAGGDIVLASMSVNTNTHQPVGLIAGGRLLLTSGAVTGDITYGAQSTIPQTVSVSGRRSLLPFNVSGAFENLGALSSLLKNEAPSGTAQLAFSTLQLTGTKPGLNVFRTSADLVRQASTIQVTIPTGAGALIEVDGTTIDMRTKGISVQGGTESTVLWNLPDALFVNISGVSIPGSMLAPSATVAFESGNISGTVVARSFASPGGGSLQYFPLKVSALLGPSTPSSVRLAPAQPLLRGCSYQFSVSSTTPVTSAGACLAAGLSANFRVADHPSTPANRELINLQHDPVVKTLRSFTARTGINSSVRDALMRYQSEIGISVADMVPGDSNGPSFTRAHETVKVYQQFTQGYPLAGYGYLVSSENSFFRSAIGKVFQGQPALAAPKINSAAALQTALTYLKFSKAPWLAHPGQSVAPVGRLAVMPTRTFPTASNFSLVWAFDLKNSGITDTAGIEVDASTGLVIGVDPGTRNVATLNTGAVYQPSPSPITANVDTIFNGSRSFVVAEYKNPDNTVVQTLATGKVDAAGVLTTSTGVTIVAGVGLSGTPQYVIDPSPGTPWTSTEVVEQKMATAQWAAEESSLFLASLKLQASGNPWLTLDGLGMQQVRVNYISDPNLSPKGGFYSGSISTPGAAQIFLNEVLAAPGVVTRAPFYPDVVSHELTHALLDNIRRSTALAPMGPFREAGAVNEGIADLFTIAFNHAEIDATGQWFCFQNATSLAGPLACLENIAQPSLGLLGVAASNKPPGQPSFFKDPAFYQDYSAISDHDCDPTFQTPATNNDLCGVHLNSTIVSHWGYLLATGSTGTTSLPCGLTLAPVDSDPDTALRIAASIAVRAGGLVGASIAQVPVANFSFAEFRDATVKVAQDLEAEGTFPNDSLVSSVKLAWDAMALPPEGAGPSSAEPTDAADYVDPWAPFVWPSNGDGQSGTSWDFQLADDASFAGTHLLFHREQITDTVVRSGKTMGTLQIALPFNAGNYFFWRVRPTPTSGAATVWLGCYPVHTFRGTGQPAPITDVHGKTVDDAGNPRPGSVDMVWNHVANAVAYDTHFTGGAQDPQCESAPGVTDAHFKTTSGTVGDAEPQQGFWVDVQAIGPKDANGDDSVGKCFGKQFVTAAMRAPIANNIGGPGMPDGATLDIGEAALSLGKPVLGDPIVVGWQAFDGAQKCRVDFVESDETGTCGTAVVRSETVDLSATPCGHSCGGKLTATPFATPNPTGYCWNVTSISKSGAVSPRSSLLGQAPVPGGAVITEDRGARFLYIDFTDAIAPGNSRGAAEQGDVAQLPGAPNTYGQPVTFSWKPDPFASSYGMRVKRWEREPFPTPDQVDPPTCFFRGTECSVAPNTFYRDTVSDTTKVLPGALASQGRYNWSVWPIYSDAPHAGIRQPLLGVTDSSYTSGPSVPKIVFDFQSKPLNTHFYTTPILGHVHFDYVPDGQYALEADSSDVTFGDRCTVQRDGITYRDVYNCDVSISIAPQPSTTYNFKVHTWNSSQHPPQMNEASELPPAIQSVTTFGCGHDSEACCPTGTPCVDDWEECDADGTELGTCRGCGGEANSCCTQGPACQPDKKALRSPGICLCASCGYETLKCCVFAGQVHGCQADSLRCDPNSDMCVPATSMATCYPNTQTPPPLDSLMTAYQQDCPTLGTCKQFDDLCEPNCEIKQSDLLDLLKDHKLRCVSALQFNFFSATETDPNGHPIPDPTYTVYAADDAGYFKKYIKLNSTNFSDGAVPATPDLHLYQIVARGTDACNNPGPASVGLVIVSSACPP